MVRRIIPYHPKLKKLAQKLRSNMTPGEIILWNQLKQKRMLGFDFDRQRPILNYIVDFYCKELQLAIEIDGKSHEGRETLDKERQARLEAVGIYVMRFEERLVQYDLPNVLFAIQTWIETSGDLGRRH
jgi:very-short-patch-repair endonuclease